MMKSYLILTLGVSLSFTGHSQFISTYNLNANNVEAIVNDGGVFFNNAGSNTAGYSVPGGSFAHTMYALSFWYGGTDVNGQLKLSAQKYTNFDDQFKGPLTTDGSAQPDNTGAWASALFPVTKAEIDDHLSNYMNTGYSPVSNIANWPAHGDVSYGFEYYLAPFVDTDGDGAYNPMAGDYPCIRGDHAVYVIMNDKGNVHASGGDPIGLEMHYLFYQYSGIPEIENTTFINLKIINRGTQTINDFKVSTFMDGDIGFYGDDYIGSDTLRNMMYFYNGLAFDQTVQGIMGYGENPPAAGVVSLSHDFEYIGIADAQDNVATSFWYNMNGQDQTGVSWVDPATLSPIQTVYPGDPADSTSAHSEAAVGNPVGDRRGVATIDFGTLVPFEEHIFDYAVVYNREEGANHLLNASGLKDVADIVQLFFDTTFVDDCVADLTVGLAEVPDLDVSIFPNPSQGTFTISIASDCTDARAQIRDLSGRVVLDELNLSSTKTVISLHQPSGVYLLQLTVDGQTTMKRIVLE